MSMLCVMVTGKRKFRLDEDDILYFKILISPSGSASSTETCQKGGTSSGDPSRAQRQRERLRGDQGNDNDDDDNDDDRVISRCGRGN